VAEPELTPEAKAGKTVATQEALEQTTAMTLSRILVTVAAICLAAVGLDKSPGQSIVDTFFGVLGLVALISAALIVDSILDNAEFNVKDRFRLMKGGYFVFCLVVSAMSFGILLLYHTNRGSTGVTWSILPPIIASILMVCKMMSYGEHIRRNPWTLALIVAYVCSIPVVLYR
jgi:hypothetical protein